MNWGKYIVLTYGIFVAGILFLVIESMMQNQDLVTDDYYAQELDYQKTLDKSKKAASISDAVILSFDEDSLYLVFSKEFSGKPISGYLEVYCPSDERRDIRIDFKLPCSENTFAFPCHETGKRTAKINWNVEGLAYYYEKDILLSGRP